MRILTCLSLLTLISCGQADLAKSVKAVDGADGKDGLMTSSDPQEPCSLTQEGDYIVYRCPGKSDVNIYHPKDNPAQSGKPGKDGKDGAKGCDTRFEKDHNGCLWAICGDNKTLVWVPQ